MRPLIMLFLVSSAVMAKEMVAEDNRLKYVLTFDEKSISYKDELTELKLIKETCNAHIFNRMNLKLEKMFERPFLKDARIEFLKIKVDGKQFYEPRYGDRAVFLIQMPDEIKKIKIEESFNCKKN